MNQATISGKSAAVGRRLREERERLQLKPRQLADSADISIHTYNKYEANVKPGADALAGLAQAGVDILYVLTGQRAEGGERFGTAAATAQRPPRVEEPQAGYAYIPLLDVRARAGRGGEIVERERAVDALAFKADWIRQELRVSPDDLRLIYVAGDSMEPDLRPGDIILIDHTDTTAQREGVYVLRMDGGLLVKQLQRLPGGVLRVISRNEAYQPFDVKLADLGNGGDMAIIGRVVWACRRL